MTTINNEKTRVSGEETVIMEVVSLSLTETYWEHCENSLALTQTIPGAPGYSDDHIDAEIDKETAIELVKILKEKFNI